MHIALPHLKNNLKINKLPTDTVYQIIFLFLFFLGPWSFTMGQLCSVTDIWEILLCNMFTCWNIFFKQYVVSAIVPILFAISAWSSVKNTFFPKLLYFGKYSWILDFFFCSFNFYLDDYTTRAKIYYLAQPKLALTQSMNSNLKKSSDCCSELI